MKKYTKILLALPLVATIGAIVACNSKFDVVLSTNPYNDSIGNAYRTQKVLLLIVDGARGQSVKDAQPPNLLAMAQTATYSWNSITDTANNVTPLADMFTGVSRQKHAINDSTLIGNKLAQYPLVFQRIKQARPNARIASFSNSVILNNKLTAGTNVNQSFATDNQVKAAVVSELGLDTATIVVGQFGSVNAAGAQYGYDTSVSQYRTAILQFDGYVGEIMTAIKARKSYAIENWLVIVTSSRGGQYTVGVNDGTVFSIPQQNTFTIFYNPSYKLKFIDKPYTGNKFDGSFVRIFGPAATAIRADVMPNNNKLDFGANDFSIELKVKKNLQGTGYSYNWPVFFSKKKDKAQKSGSGWAFSLEGTSWRFLIGNTTDNHLGVTSPAITDGNWHTYSVVVVNRNNNRYIRSFTDGKFNSEVQITANFLNTIDDVASPLTIGLIPTDLTNPFDGFISDIRIWLVALPDVTVSQYSCDIEVPSTHPYYSLLAGNWTCRDGSGNKFKDKSVLGNDFTILQGGSPSVPGSPVVSPTWVSSSSIICPPPASDLASFVPNSKDIAIQVLSWLGIPTADSWGLDGRVWLNQ